ncbi:Uncharacterised protein [Acinetobacter baumannii]|nr:Uncharacterised protein [Acinetobacter baumannii]
MQPTNNHKPLTINQEPIIDSSSNTRGENSQLTPIQFAQYQIDDHKRYSMREFISEYSEFHTPSIWLVKWFSWVQNNEKQVAANRKKQEQINSAGQKPQESGYFANLFEEQSESQIVDVTPAKKFPMIEEVGHA